MDNRKSFQCPLCNKILDTKFQYSIHLKVVHKSRPNKTYKIGVQTKTR